MRTPESAEVLVSCTSPSVGRIRLPNLASMNLASRLLVAAFVLLAAGCATHRASVPEINEPPREGLSLNQPVLFSVFDARADKSNSEQVTGAIERGIARAYGSAVEQVGHFEPVPEGRVAVRIRLMANGADFGSRLISATAISNSFATARAQSSDFWQPVVTVAAEQSSVTTAFEAEGWWVGTSWLEIEIQDQRPDDADRITLPIVAEERESNTFGYRSAGRASSKAWGRASQQLFHLMDTLLTTLRDQGA